MTTATRDLRQLYLSDLLRLSGTGLRTRKLRAALSALGIAIGVAAIVAVLGLSQSAEAGLLAQIDALGTNLLTASNGQTLFGQEELLEHEPDAAGAEEGDLVVAEGGHVRPGHTHRTRGRPVKSAHEMQQRGLART